MRILRTLAVALFLFAAICALLLLVHRRLPYLESGSDIVTHRKKALSERRIPFSTHGLHVITFGDSRVLSGMIPAVFDSIVSQRTGRLVESYNYGLPGDSLFVDDLRRIVVAGSPPDLVLLTAPWPDSVAQPDLFHFLMDDDALMRRAFPFRRLPRDLVLLAAEARGRPGAMRALYAENARLMASVERDHGYYFITRQSHFANDELPAGFRLPTDQMQTPELRRIARTSIAEGLDSLLATRGVRALFVPTVFRTGRFAPAPAVDSQAVAALTHFSQIELVGPDYFEYPNSAFSDPVHLNPRGARRYTRDVAVIVADWISRHPELSATHR